MAAATSHSNSEESTFRLVGPTSMSTVAGDNSSEEYTTADEEGSNPTSPVPYITRTGKPIRSCPASAFLVQFQRSAPDTASCTFNIRAPATTPASHLSSYGSGVRSPVTEGTPDSNFGSHASPANVKANLTAASAFLHDFMLTDEDVQSEPETNNDAQRLPIRSKTVDIVVPRPVVAAAAVEKLGKQVEEAKVQNIKEKRAKGNANTDGASSNDPVNDGEKAKSRSGSLTVAVSS